MDFIPSYAYFIAISFLASLTVFARHERSDDHLQLFPPYLFLTLAAEVTGSYFFSIGKNNVILYNLFSTFEFCFYLFWISLVVRNGKAKTIIRLTMALYGIAALANIFWGQGLKTFHTFTYSVGCVLIVIACIYYFLELFRYPTSAKLQYTPAFWICSALLFFYCCSFPLYSLLNFWIQVSNLVIKNFTQIATILNIFLYSLFTIGFLCIRTRRYTLSPSSE